MDIFEANKMLLAIFFLIPGFVCIKTYTTLTGASSLDASKVIVDAIAFSCLTYAIASPVIYLAWENRWLQAGWTSFILWPALLFALPCIEALAWFFLRKTQLFQKILPHPTGKAWDHVFGSRRCYYVIITLKSGRRIGGAYGEASFTSSGSHEEQIYIEKIWEIDEEQGFIEERKHTCGMLISHDRIETIEFIWTSNDQKNTAVENGADR